jgi:hypothetical protein
MSLRVILVTVIASLRNLKRAARTAAIKSALIIYLSHVSNHKDLFNDQLLLVSIVEPLALTVANRSEDESSSALALELLLLLSNNNPDQVQEILLECWTGENHDYYNDFCDRLEKEQPAYLDGQPPSRFEVNMKLMIPYIDKDEPSPTRNQPKASVRNEPVPMNRN